jgi:tyrosyl-tRNA synthetase
MLDKETIDAAIAEHRADPGRRTLQQLLAKEITTTIHGAAEYENAVSASKMLFGNSTSDELRKLDEKTFLAVFAGVPTFDVPRSELPCDILDFLAVKTQVFPSKGEARKMTVGNGVSINKDKVTDPAYQISEADIVDGKYILAQKGKKNYFIINII